MVDGLCRRTFRYFLVPAVELAQGGMSGEIQVQGGVRVVFSEASVDESSPSVDISSLVDSASADCSQESRNLGTD